MDAWAYLLGVLGSIPLDWCSRRYVERTLSYELLEELPIPVYSTRDPRSVHLIGAVGRLAATDNRFAKWAETVGVECGPLADDQKDHMIHELDAAVAHLCGLSESHLVHIFETFHEG
jgi:hypothetical protein